MGLQKLGNRGKKTGVKPLSNIVLKIDNIIKQRLVKLHNHVISLTEESKRGDGEKN